MSNNVIDLQKYINDKKVSSKRQEHKFNAKTIMEWLNTVPQYKSMQYQNPMEYITILDMIMTELKKYNVDVYEE